MNRFLIVAIAAISFAATPALAQGTKSPSSFTGARIGANVGFADDDIFGTEEFTYGAEIGYDFATGGAVLGLTGEVQASDEIDRELALTARAGARVGNNALLYVTGGYSNLKAYGVKLDGARLGVGGEIGFGEQGFAKIEQRYGDYEYGVELWQTVIGLGFRF